MLPCLAAGILAVSSLTLSAAGRAEQVVLLVWDGMRPDFITESNTPTLYRLAHEGVFFQNHHSSYCSATEVNGTAMATGKYPEHTGIIANRIYIPEVNPLRGLDTQSSETIHSCDQLSNGNYLMGLTMAEILQAAGKKTAVAGSKQVAILQDRRPRPDGYPQGNTVFEGHTIPASLLPILTNQFGRFPFAASTTSLLPNERRDEWTTRVLLGNLWSNSIPKLSILWLSEPDFSQHASGPGSPKALAALASCDRKLSQVLAELDRRGLRDKTDVFVVSDHGFSTVARSIDMAKVLRDGGFKAQREFKTAPAPGDILVLSQGGSTLFHVIGRDRTVTRNLAQFLQKQDFAGVVLTREEMPGTFTLSQAKLESWNSPDVVVSMRWSPEKSGIGTPGVFDSDGSRRGAGNHASLSRFDLHNILVGSGPDLKKGFVNTFASGNTDLAPTFLWLLGVTVPQSMDGRVLGEALTVDAPAVEKPVTRRLEANRSYDKFVWRQYLQFTRVNDTVYLDEGNGAQSPK